MQTIETIATITDDGTLTAAAPRSFPRGRHRVKIVLDEESRSAKDLERSQDEEIREQYRRAYGENGGLGDEFEGWETQGVWPPE